MSQNLEGFEARTVLRIKVSVFCVPMSHKFSNISQVFAAFTIRAILEAARTSAILVNFYQTTWHYNPEDSFITEIMYFCILDDLVLYICIVQYILQELLYFVLSILQLFELNFCRLYLGT
jgi:hypothetical protein